MPDLIVMRLADMGRVHPRQDNTRACIKCGHQVGIYPFGQAVLRHDPTVRIVCSVCREPGALLEPLESVPAKEPPDA